MKKLLNIKIKILPALILGISLIGVIAYAGITQKSVLVSPRNQITAMGWNDLVKDITALNLALDGKLDINGDGSQLSGIGGSDAKIGTLTNTKWCVSDGSKINCASDAPSGGVSAWGDLTGIPAGFSDGTDNVLDETTVDSYANNNGYLKLDANSRLGIGVASPSQKLEVDGNMAVSGFITSSAPTEDNQVAVKGYVDLMLDAFTKFVDGDDSNDAIFTGGKVGIGLTNPTESLTVTGNIKNNGFMQIGQMLTADLPVCNSSKLGAIVYNTTEDDLFVCTARSGGTWKPLGEDDVPSVFTFTDQTEVNLNSVIESNIVQITGFSVNTKVNIAGVSTPQFRICADATCSSVLQTWGNTEKTMSNNQYLQLRQTSSSEVLASVSASVSVGGINEVWQVETKDEVALYTDDVFSTYLYTGNGATQTINNGVALASTAEWSAFKLQPTNEGVGKDIVTDSDKNIYVIGSSSDGIVYHHLITKYNQLGVLQWQRKLEGNDGYNFSGIIIDASNNIYINCIAKDGIGYYSLIVKYNSSGVLQWQKKLYQGNNSAGKDIAIDSNGNIYITGYAYSGSNYYVLTAKYNSSGILQWQKKLYQGIDNNGEDIAIDSNDNIYITGYLNNGTDNDIVIAKYNSSGDLQWQRKLKQNNSSGYGITTDSLGNIFITGKANDGTNYIVIAKYNSSGILQWQRKLKQNDSEGRDISCDSSNNIYVIGRANDGINYYILIAKYDNNGTLQWQRKLKQNNSYGYGINTNSLGDVYITGQANDGTKNYIIIAKLKQDGSTTSGTAFVTMTAGTATDSAGTATDSAGTATDSAGTATDSAGTATESAGTAISSIATQPAVESEGGLVWVKHRSGSTSHILTDTLRGYDKQLSTNTSNAQNTGTTNLLTSFNSNGFSLGSGSSTNNNTDTFTSWTFRKAPKFFDVVTYTGDGTSNRQIAHSLGIEPGMINTKSTSTTGDWNTYHRSATGDLKLNTTDAQTGSKTIVPTASTTTFTVSGVANTNGVTYVAYLYAHDPDPDGKIQCGSYVGTGASPGPRVELGWEPQWIMYKSASTTGDWGIHDSMRGLGTGSSTTSGTGNRLEPNTSDTETGASNFANLDSTGFIITPTVSDINGSGQTYIYCAIRRPNKPPVSSTGVYKTYGYNGTDTDGRDLANAGFPPDLAMFTSRTQQNTWWTPAIVDRLRGNGTHIATNRTDAEGGAGNGVQGYFTQTGITVGRYGTWGYGNYSGGNPWLTYYFRRAPGFFDIVAYTGTGVKSTVLASATNADRQINHNLVVKPSMAILKKRSGANNWGLIHKEAKTSGGYLRLNSNIPADTGTGQMPDSWYGETFFIPGYNRDFPNNEFNEFNESGQIYIAYLFATLPGISKVGSYTGTGTQQDIDAGFATGPAFLLIKRTDATGDWYLWDSTRGIVSAGNDPYLLLNSTAAEVTTTNYIDPINTGFRLTSTAPAALNASGGTYIYYSVAKP